MDSEASADFHLRAECEGVVSVKTRVAGPESGTAGFIISIGISIGAIVLCGIRKSSTLIK